MRKVNIQKARFQHLLNFQTMSSSRRIIQNWGSVNRGEGCGEKDDSPVSCHQCAKTQDSLYIYSNFWLSVSGEKDGNVPPT